MCTGIRSKIPVYIILCKSIKDDKLLKQVGDAELATKLATSRLQQIGNGGSKHGALAPMSQLSLTNNGEIVNGMAMIDMM